jgi:hypothetical protein
VSDEFKQSAFLYEEYYVKDGETPESLAFDFYGSTQYHWVLLLCNEIIYVWNDWALPQLVLTNYTIDKYGVDNLYATHHYVDAAGYVTSNAVGTYPVSNLAYETEINDEKRYIKVLNRGLLHAFIKNFNELAKLTK